MSDEGPLTQLPHYQNVKLIGADFAADFFADARTIDIKLTLLEDLWQDLQTLCAENGWSVEEGLRIVLGSGLAYLRRRSDEGSLEAKHAYLDLSAQYTVMKFRTFQFMQAAQVLDMKLNVAQGELAQLRAINERLRAEVNQRNQTSAE
jgi:hypothetical protein